MEFGGLSEGTVLRALLEGLESAGFGCTMGLVDGNGARRVYANEAYARMRGIDVETAMTRDPFVGMPEEDAERIAMQR
jgi:hypothetical protein